MQRGIFFHLFFAKRKGEAKRKVFAYGAKMMVGRMERSDILRGNESKACFRQKVKHCPTLLKEKVKKKKSVRLWRKDDGWENGAKRHSQGQ